MVNTMESYRMDISYNGLCNCKYVWELAFLTINWCFFIEDLQIFILCLQDFDRVVRNPLLQRQENHVDYVK